MGKRLRGEYLLFVVKDQYHSELRRSGLYRMHSWCGPPAGRGAIQTLLSR